LTIRRLKQAEDRWGKRTRCSSGNIGSIFKYEEESSPSIGNSMLKEKANERNNFTLVNKMNDSST